MGWNVDSADRFDFSFKKEVKVTLSGLCPMCGEPFNVESDDEWFQYECPCGYFTYYANDNTVRSDNHNTPKETCVENLRKFKEKAGVAQTPRPTVRVGDLLYVNEWNNGFDGAGLGIRTRLVHAVEETGPCRRGGWLGD